MSTPLRSAPADLPIARVLLLATLAITGTLVACRTPPVSRPELLDKLTQCRNELSQGQSTGWFVSPCVKLDPAPLNGISRIELAAALGRPTFCTSLSEGVLPPGSDCPPQMDPKWAFFRGAGAGPELTCETDESQHCQLVRWLKPE
jgi:hypothetical protein